MNEDFKKIQKQLSNDFIILGIFSAIILIFYLMTELNFINIIYTILLFVGYSLSIKGKESAGKIGIIVGTLMLLTILDFDIIDSILGIFVLKRSIKYNKFFSNNSKQNSIFWIGLSIFIIAYVSIFFALNLTTNKSEVNNFENCILDAYNEVSSSKIENYLELTQEDFESIKDLSCNKKNISEVDLSNLINLENLELMYNNIKTINLSNNTKIKKIVLENNQISQIDLSKNVNLEHISLSYNKLSNINLENNINLKELWLNDTLISNINLSNQKLLEEVFLYGNSIETIDLSQNKNLKVLWLGKNPIKNLDISQNYLLEELQIERTYITSINIKNNNNLKFINANSSVEIIGKENNPNLLITND